MFTIVTGDIFAKPVDVPTMFINGVNCQGTMGAGIAKTYRDIFPDMYESYVAAVRSGALTPGGFHVWHDDDQITIGNVASQNGYHDATVEWLIDGLFTAIEWAEDHGIEEIRTPLVGGGLGGIEPALAQAAIAGCLCETDIDSTLYLYEAK